jgi:hypothetical protein
VRLAPDIVEDDARHVQPWVEGAAAEDNGRGAAEGPGDVYHEHYRRLQQPGDVGGAGGVVARMVPVEEPHDPFDDRDIGLGGGANEELAHGALRTEPAVEVARGPARGPRVVPGIDVVRADLEGLHAKATPAQGSDEAQGQCGLAAVAGDGSDDEAWKGRHARDHLLAGDPSIIPSRPGVVRHTIGSQRR